MSAVFVTVFLVAACVERVVEIENESLLIPENVSMDQVEREQIDWLWLHRFPRGKLSLIGGMQGVGKGMMITDMAARISMGLEWPDLLHENKSALTLDYLCLER